ncbi:2'-5' RNA ligase family protein [Carbonactinospora thermoautotrophica]|uniref:2'-5' RNA ligase family protein n=1 Tax=Carbonactinospora thermoautotrophica TaxID=1469144 RepID=UPI003DA96616
MGRSSGRLRTIGVAVAIPEPYGTCLQSYRESFGDPLARAIPTHVTLLPPTAVSPVVFVQLAQGISDCERIERRIRSGPLARELKFNYHPHVTVAHDVPDEMLDLAFEKLSSFEAKFEVLGFSLYEHGQDGVWRPQRDFVFGQVFPGPHPTEQPAG